MSTRRMSERCRIDPSVTTPSFAASMKGELPLVLTRFVHGTVSAMPRPAMMGALLGRISFSTWLKGNRHATISAASLPP